MFSGPSPAPQPPALPGHSAALFPQCQMAGSAAEGGHLTQVTTMARTHFSGLGRQEDEWSRVFWEESLFSLHFFLPQGRGEVVLPSAGSAAARGHHVTSTTTSSIRSTSLGESRTSLETFFFFLLQVTLAQST